MEGDPHTHEDHQHCGHCEKKPNGITGHRLREKSSDRRGVCGITRRHRNRGHCRNDRRQEDARGHERRELRFEVFTRVEHFAQRQWNHRRREFLETQPEQQSGAGDEQPGIGVERKCAAFGRKAAQTKEVGQANRDQHQQRRDRQSCHLRHTSRDDRRA